MRANLLSALVVGALLVPGTDAQAAPSAKQIVDRAIDNQAFSLPGAEMRMKMLLRNRRGGIRERQLFSKTKQKGGLSRTLTRFVAPPDVAGTSFLFVEKKGQEDEQHMYMPALKMVKRIAGAQKNARFMGSDFSYADMESRDLENAGHKLLKSEKVAGVDCYLVEAIPTNKTAYAKVHTWVRKKDFVFVRTRYFDTKGRELKTVFVKAVTKVGGRPIPSRIKVSNVQTKHSTLLEITQIKARGDLPESEFTIRTLKKR
jgi:outer membrane lipoprotein-sorting protein